MFKTSKIELHKLKPLTEEYLKSKENTTFLLQFLRRQIFTIHKYKVVFHSISIFTDYLFIINCSVVCKNNTSDKNFDLKKTIRKLKLQ